MANFNQDKAFGEKMEANVLALIKRKYPNAYKVKGLFKPFDIFVPEIKKRVEVKYDKRSLETGNFFIETSFKGESSGIETTEADFWVLCDGSNYFWFETETLKWACKEFGTKIKSGTVEGVILKVPVLDLWTLNKD